MVAMEAIEYVMGRCVKIMIVIKIVLNLIVLMIRLFIEKILSIAYNLDCKNALYRM